MTCGRFKFYGTLFFVLSFVASAKTFKSKFVSLELPPNWDCQQEELDWVCQPENVNLRNEALVVVVTKAANPNDDSLAKYEEYLKSPKQMRDLVGNSYTTDIKYTKQKKIGDQIWVDSLQIGSEVPGFVSRYVTSIKEQVAALISYHVAESVFPKWAEVLDKMLSLPNYVLIPRRLRKLCSQNMKLFGNRPGAMGQRKPTATQDKLKEPESTSGDLMMNILGAAMILGAVGFLIYKKRKGNLG
ncbi:MAG: hypothetical protein R3A80_02200 [Bdellovibrionota bacterium]